MRKLLLALGLLAIAVTAAAQDIQQDGSGNCINRHTGQRVDCTTGAVVSTEAVPFYDQIIQPTVLIGPGSAFSGGTADSNAVPIDTHRMSSGTLYFKCWRTATGVSTVARFAVEIRAHLNAGTDSTTIMVIHPIPQGLLTTPDTLGVFGQTIQPAATTPGSGEWPLAVDLQRGSTLGAGGLASTTFPYPNGFGINLAKIYGPSLGIGYMSVRVRELTGPACLLTVTFEGRP
jgi:hypothetical protein